MRLWWVHGPPTVLSRPVSAPGPSTFPRPSWTATSPFTPLIPGTTYILYGWTKDNSWSASSVSFTLADRDRLTPGTVRYVSTSGHGHDSAISVPVTEFKAEACPNG